MQEEPEMAEVVVNDGSIFLSDDGLPLQLSTASENLDMRKLGRDEEEPLILRK